MKHRFITTYLLLSLFICGPGRQYALAQLENITPQLINETNGLSNNSPSCFLQDEKGYMWIGTQEGLNRYDGYSFKIFRKIPGDSNSIARNNISRLVEDKEHNIWIGFAEGGIGCYNPKEQKFTNYFPKVNSEDISHAGISMLFIDSKDNLWIGLGQHGLWQFDKTKKTFESMGTLPDINPAYALSMQKNYNTVYQMIEDSSGAFWLATHNGLYRFNAEEKTLHPVRAKPVIPYQPRDDLFSAMLQDKNGNLWMGAFAGGISAYNIKTGEWKNFKYKTSEKKTFITNVIADMKWKNEHELWVTISGYGFGTFDTKEEKFHFTDNFFNSKNDDETTYYGIIFTDREGDVWITNDKGISFIGGNSGIFSFRKLPVTYSSNGKYYDVGLFYKDTVNHLLLATTTYADGINLINEKTGTHEHISFDVRKEEGEALVGSAIMQDHLGKIWITTRDYIYQFDMAARKMVKVPQPLPDSSFQRSPYFYQIKEDSQHRIWITTLRTGVYLLEPETFKYTHFDHDEKNPSSICATNITNVMEDAGHHIWFCSAGKGISRYDEISKKFINYSHSDSDSLSLVNDIVTGLTTDSEGNLWLSSFGGLSKVVSMQNGKVKFINYTLKEGLTSELISDLVGDNSGNIWFTSSTGLNELNVATNQIKNFTTKDGLPHLYYTFSFSKADDGEIFIGTLQGYLHFYPDSIRRRELPQQVVINSFKVFDKEKNLRDDQNINLSYAENFFSFDFAAINFSSPEKNTYAYMLDGFDKDWVLCGHRRYAGYTNLNGGNYFFKVKAQNADGVWSKEISIPVHIEPPYWKKAWFILVLSGLISMLIYALYLFRVKQIRRAEGIKTELNKKIAEVEMRALRAQMNPHFIFNCLNSINRYIVKSDTKTASLYLTKFSKLIRLILDNSENKNVTLSSELESLKLYIDMESIRFENKFNFKVNVHDDVNAESISIPPLIIQPYVENAIWHGLLNKESAGKLSVDVSRQNSTLQCIIEDDGVGRAKAKELKSKSATTRKSLGIKLTEDRLAMLNEHTEKKSSVEIIDLKDNSGNDCGTRVIIKIPLWEN